MTDRKESVLEQEEQLAEDSLETRFLTPDKATFTRTPGGFASLTVEGVTYDRVLLVRTFPFTDPNRYVSVREADNDNREIGLILDLSQWDEQTAGILGEQLNLRYFTPKIQKIHEIKEQYGYSYWHVDTDKGECKFTCDQNGVAKLSETRLLISDVDGNRFELPDVTVLSAKELRMVDLYM